MSDDLLARVLEAHGGLENWNPVTRLTAKLSLGGPFWEFRGWPGIYADQTVTLETRREHITFAPFTAPDRVSVLDVDPERVRIQTTDGAVLEERMAPRASFPLPFDDFETKWDAVQVAYFTSAATWNYLTVPFVFTYPGVTAKEIDPWDEDGETWRRLAVTFPPDIANHNPDQVFYYDERYMLRRMDYSPDVTGSPRVAHYTHDPQTFGGLVFPTRRRVHLYDEDGNADQSFAPITLDVERVTVHREQSSSNGARPGEQNGTVDMKLEVAVLPVSDVDRAKDFYERLGWRLDADFVAADELRVVQLTPPGSEASIIFGNAITSAAPGSVEGLQLTVSDIEAARDELVGRGVEVSETFHDAGGIFHHAGSEGRIAGPAPEHGDYGSFASFSDPDGNGWLLQEVKVRAPGR